MRFATASGCDLRAGLERGLIGGHVTGEGVVELVAVQEQEPSLGGRRQTDHGPCARAGGKLVPMPRAAQGIAG
jgi:hypothetical protein